MSEDNNPLPLAHLVGATSFVFGLEAQGHITAVENMIKDGRDWTFIGRAIGWDGETAKAYYERYLARNPATPENRCLKCGAQDDERWDCCETHEATFPSPETREVGND